MRRAGIAITAMVVAASIVLIGTGRGAGASSSIGYETDVNPGSGLQFVSPTTGFALAGQPVNSLDNLLSAPSGLTVVWPSPAVLVSRDGGRTWRRSLSAPAGLWGLAFADHLHGIAVGVKKLYRTADGGLHWQQIPEPRQPLVRVVYYTDPETVVGITTQGRLVMSRKGGSRWESSSWHGRARALCALGGAVVIADPDGGVWLSKAPEYPFVQVAAGVKPRIQYGPWWVGLSCTVQNGVESMLSVCEAACGGGTQTIIRQGTAGPFRRWRRLAVINTGANPGAPQPAGEAVAVGTRSACIFFDPRRPTLEISCTSDGGRSFSQADTPQMPGSRYPGVHLQGVSFLGSALAWLLVDDTIVNDHEPPRYQTQVWATNDGGASWMATYKSPLGRVPSLP